MGGCLSHIIDGSSSTHEYDCVPCCGEYDPSPRRRSKFKGKQKKRRVMEILAAEARSNDILYRTVGRMCSNGSTSNACVFTQQGRKGINQDAMIVWENFDSSCANTTFCGVFDGHGPFGHLVARKVRDALPSKIAALKLADERNTIAISGSASAPTTERSLVLEEQHQKWFTAWRDCFTRAYHSMDKELKSHPTIDSFCSGTTAVTMLLQGRDMLVANVGDSRAVLGTLSVDDDSRVEAVQLTVDLKPNLPLEAERIKRCKGRVFALEDEPEVARVWLPHDDSPGLAMARAFGDFCLKDFGLIAVPEVTYARVAERDQFVVLASDGIWDVLSNKEVVETIWEAPTRTTAARALVETAVRAWRLKYPTSKVDDCAVVCYFFNKQQQRRQDLPDMVVSASSSSSGSLAMAELDIVDINIDHLQVDLPIITRALSPAAAVMDVTVDHELVLPESKDHENNFCASATAASLTEVTAGIDVQENHTECDGQKMTAGSTKTGSMAGVDIHQEPSVVSSSSSAMDKALHTKTENGNQNIICEQGEGLLQRSDTLRSANADVIPIISPLSLSSVVEPSFESDSPQEDGKSFVTIAGPELLLDIGENGVHHTNVLSDEAISVQLNKYSSHMSDESLTSTESRAENTSSLGSPPPKDWSLCPETDQHAAENTSNRLGSSPPVVCSLAPESDRHIAINRSTDPAQDEVDDVRLQTIQEAVSSQLHHSQIDTEITQSSTSSATAQATSAFTMDFAAASRFMPEFEGAPSEITVMTEEEGDTGKASPFLARSASRRSLAECLSVADDEEWSALEGVARVNSLLNLPRFLQRGRSEIIRRANSKSSQTTDGKKKMKKKKKKTPLKLLLSWEVLSFKRIAQKISARNKSKKKKEKEIAFEEGAEEQMGIWY